jgi:hypothetical protein
MLGYQFHHQRRGGEGEGCQLMISLDALITFWLMFASQATGLPIPANAAPVVIFDQTATQGAVTLWNGEIVLTKSWHGSSPEDNCQLAHELTHYLQIVNHQKFACTAAYEPAAYRVQAACHRRYGDRRLENLALSKAKSFGTVHVC